MNRKQEKYVNMLLAFCWRGYPCLYNSLFPKKSPTSNVHAKKIMKHLKITDSKSVKEKLEWYLIKGYRGEFYSLHNTLLFLSESEMKERLKREDEETLVKISTVQKYNSRLNENSIGAFDISNTILLTKHALKVGLLSLKEAEAYEIRAAKLAQNMYTGWNEYLTSYIAGVQFVRESTNEQEKYLQEQKNTIIKLIASKYSPFRKIDFYTSFS